MGNTDFEEAEKTITVTINNMHLPEADYFMENFMPAFMLTLDDSKSN